jgi:HupE / UreJ protein
LRSVLLALLLALAALAAPAGAHPLITRNLRVVHFATADNGDLLAWYRLTLPLVVGRGVPMPAPGTPVPSAPYTLGRWDSGVAFWFADIPAIVRDPEGLGRMVLDGHSLTARGAPVPGRLISVAIHPKGHAPPFDTPEQARAAASPGPWPADVTEIDSGYVLVDVAIAYTLPPGARRFELSSTLDPGALGEAGTVNLFVDHRGGRVVYYRVEGLLPDPVVVAPGLFEGIGSFVLAGAAHILTGADHLLFLLCLVLGARRLSALVWRVSGFTVGHAIALALGFYGLLPRPAWFDPGVDAAMAASILLAGAACFIGRGERAMPLVTLGLGLVHGLAVADALRDLLAADGPNVIQGLAGFNAGVELGQLAVGFLVFALFRALRRFAATERWARFGAVGLAMAVAVVWLVERVPAVWAAARNGY